MNNLRNIGGNGGNRPNRGNRNDDMPLRRGGRLNLTNMDNPLGIARRTRNRLMQHTIEPNRVRILRRRDVSHIRYNPGSDNGQAPRIPRIVENAPQVQLPQIQLGVQRQVQEVEQNVQPRARRSSSSSRRKRSHAEMEAPVRRSPRLSGRELEAPGSNSPRRGSGRSSQGSAPRTVTNLSLIQENQRNRNAQQNQQPQLNEDSNNSDGQVLDYGFDDDGDYDFDPFVENQQPQQSQQGNQGNLSTGAAKRRKGNSGEKIEGRRESFGLRTVKTGASLGLRALDLAGRSVVDLTSSIVGSSLVGHFVGTLITGDNYGPAFAMGFVGGGYLGNKGYNFGKSLLSRGVEWVKGKPDSSNNR